MLLLIEPCSRLQQETQKTAACGWSSRLGRFGGWASRCLHVPRVQAGKDAAPHWAMSPRLATHEPARVPAGQAESLPYVWRRVPRTDAPLMRFASPRGEKSGLSWTRPVKRASPRVHTRGSEFRNVRPCPWGGRRSSHRRFDESAGPGHAGLEDLFGVAQGGGGDRLAREHAG